MGSYSNSSITAAAALDSRTGSCSSSSITAEAATGWRADGQTEGNADNAPEVQISMVAKLATTAAASKGLSKTVNNNTFWGRGRGRGPQKRRRDWQQKETPAAKRARTLNLRVTIKHDVESLLTGRYGLDVNPVSEHLRTLISNLLPLEQ